MNNHFQMAVKFIYSIIEQFVFYLAAGAGFLAWIYFGNIYISVFVFVFICGVFWALPSLIKRNK